MIMPSESHRLIAGPDSKFGVYVPHMLLDRLFLQAQGVSDLGVPLPLAKKVEDFSLPQRERGERVRGRLVFSKGACHG